jgi:hypothetical protein
MRATQGSSDFPLHSPLSARNPLHPSTRTLRAAPDCRAVCLARANVPAASRVPSRRLGARPAPRNRRSTPGPGDNTPARPLAARRIHTRTRAAHCEYTAPTLRAWWTLPPPVRDGQTPACRSASNRFLFFALSGCAASVVVRRLSHARRRRQVTPTARVRCAR